MNKVLFGLLLVLWHKHTSGQSFTFITADPPGSTSSSVIGINNSGQIVGSYQNASGTHNYLRSADGLTFTSIDAPEALPGQTFLTGINTCQLCGANSFDYLTELQRHARELTANPAEWMPWNYRETLGQAGV